jgi:hypothetical protein
MLKPRQIVIFNDKNSLAARDGTHILRYGLAAKKVPDPTPRKWARDPVAQG